MQALQQACSRCLWVHLSRSGGRPLRSMIMGGSGQPSGPTSSLHSHSHIPSMPLPHTRPSIAQLQARHQRTIKLRLPLLALHRLPPIPPKPALVCNCKATMMAGSGLVPGGTCILHSLRPLPRTHLCLACIGKAAMRFDSTRIMFQMLRALLELAWL